MRSFFTGFVIVGLLLGAVGAWLAMEQEETLRDLHSAADRSGLSVTIDLEAPSGRSSSFLPGDLGSAPWARSDESAEPRESLSLFGETDSPEAPIDGDPTEPAAGLPPDEGDDANGVPDTPFTLPGGDEPGRQPSEPSIADLSLDEQVQPAEPGDRIDTAIADSVLEARPDDTGRDAASGRLARPERLSEPDTGTPADSPDDPAIPAQDEERPPLTELTDQTPPGQIPDLPEVSEPDTAVTEEAEAQEEPTPVPAPATALPTPANPAIALVVLDLGQSSAATESAIQRLPDAVTLAFSPYANTLSRWIPQARAAGHEVLLMIPMEPVSYPRNDPGPQTLLTSLTTETNLGRLDWALNRAEDYIGVVNNMGSRMTASRDSIEPVLEAVRDKGLMFLDSRTASNSVVPAIAREIDLPVAVNDRFIDQVAARNEIDQQLAELEAVAQQRGYAVGLARPYPVSFERIAAWLPSLEEKGIDLVPISRVTHTTDSRQAATVP